MACPTSGPRERLRILVLGFSVRWPVGGGAWHYLQYVLGLHRLGHDVYFVEDSDDYPSCWDRQRNEMTCDPAFGIAFTGAAFDRLGLGDRWLYYDAHQRQWHGERAADAVRLCESADVLLNVSGVTRLGPWLREVPIRVLIDTDPVFTQVNCLTNHSKSVFADEHNRFLTFGENFAAPEGDVPDDGRPWQPTRQPIVLDAWKSERPVATTPRFTTVMQWESYPSVEFRGRKYGMKSASFPRFESLPRRTPAVLEMAAARVPPATAERLRQSGWRLRDGGRVSTDPWRYQRYIQGSPAEFSVAKQGYVAARCGWFSERSACYLAAGRPVVVQDTGFSRWLPTGRGVLGFDSLDGARHALDSVLTNYDLHRRAARELAEAYFDSDDVLRRLLEQITSGHAPRRNAAASWNPSASS